MGVIRVTDLEGRTHELDAVEGWRVMEIIREHGFDAGGICGGACACATCHVYVTNGWGEKLPPKSDAETDMLDMALAVEENSRLSCQLVCGPELDGITVTIAPE